MKEEWLFHGAVVPIDVETTAALVAEIKRLIDVIGGMALAQPEQDNTYIYASNLAKTIWQKHYIKESPKFALLDTTEGVLTQIDNMTCGLVREKPAQPEQKPMHPQLKAMLEEYFYKTFAESAPPQHESTCAECDKKQSDGWALYCVNCLREFYKHDPTNKREWVGLTLTQVKLLWEGVQEEAIKSGDSLNWVFYTHINEALKNKNTRRQE